LLRLCFLGTNPNGLSVEEASTGYDAYSMLLTGSDRYGDFLPIFARSFDDYIEAIYRYFDIPFIAVFGLNEFTTRLPAAITGTLTVIIVYYLAKEAFNNNKIGFFSALLLAINPWHIQFSRIAFRGIIFPFFFCLGLWLFLKGLRRPSNLICSAFFFGLSLYTYSAARVFVPLFLAGLIIIYYQELWNHKKYFLTAGSLFLVILGIMIFLWLTPAGMARQSQVGLTFNPLKIAYNYISYFTPQFLFANGDPYLRHNPSKMGMLHIFEFISVVTGIFYLFQEQSKTSKILFLWLILYPIPAALTAPIHALRGIIGSPLFAIISSYGIVKLTESIKFSKQQINLFLIFIITLSLAGYSYRFFGDYPKESSKEWSYGMREAINYTENQNQCIMISNGIGLVHIFVLFYSQYPPQEYQKAPIEPYVGVGKIGKYEIVNFSDQNKLNFDCILMVTPGELTTIFKPKFSLDNLYTVKNPDGNPIFEFIKINSLK
jgi:hypothetical protein